MKKLWARLKEHMRKLKADLKPMSTKDKLDHLWTYYKWVAVVLAVIVVITCVTISSIQNSNRETLLGGMLINTDISLDGFNYLTEDYYARIAGELDEGVEREDVNITLESIAFADPELGADPGYAFDSVQKFEAELSVFALDYFFTDSLGMNYCALAAAGDLRDVLTEEELASFAANDDVIYAKDEDGSEIPIALRVRNMAYGKKYVQSTHEIYFGFVDNTKRPAACRELWEHLMDLEAE